MIRYAVVGKPFTKQRIDGKKKRVPKKIHMIENGIALCKTENGYKKTPSKQYMLDPLDEQICKLCKDIHAGDNTALVRATDQVDRRKAQRKAAKKENRLARKKARERKSGTSVDNMSLQQLIKTQKHGGLW